MAASPFFARIRDHVLQLAAAIPEGRICTHQSIGDYLDVMPRHVAYILSQLDSNEKLHYPWHRVSGSNGSLGSPKHHPDGTPQAELLRQEGLLISGNRVQSNFEDIFIPAEQLPSGLPRQRRPADAPEPSTCSPRKRGKK
jgi:methylated-DNA-protein-cysteine methyltransferase related protein